MERGKALVRRAAGPPPSASAGYQMHMSKPVDASELTTAIAAMIGLTEKVG